MMDVWSEFGGLTRELNHLSFALLLAATENVTLALIYDQELKRRDQRLDRSREGEVDFHLSFFSGKRRNQTEYQNRTGED